MEVSKNFKLQEFVPRSIYEKWGRRSLFFLDHRIIQVAQAIREYFDKPMRINDWHLNKGFHQRGFRCPDANVGAYLSQHKFGRAIDFNIDSFTSDKIRNSILKDHLKISPYISAIELGTKTWVHIDIRQKLSDGLIKISL